MGNLATVTKGRSRTKSRSIPIIPGKYDEIMWDLRRQRAELLHEAGKPLSAGIEIETLPDLVDQASVEADQHFVLSLRERERRLLKQIDDALGRLATGTYGTCEGCGHEIPFKRLKARPMTTLCIECKTRQEEEERIRQ